MCAALIVAKEVIEGLECEFVITSGKDGMHMKRSLHYKGLAFDFRSRHMLRNTKQQCIREIKRRLGDDFDVVQEPDHIHIEWDEK